MRTFFSANNVYFIKNTNIFSKKIFFQLSFAANEQPYNLLNSTCCIKTIETISLNKRVSKPMKITSENILHLTFLLFCDKAFQKAETLFIHLINVAIKSAIAKAAYILCHPSTIMEAFSPMIKIKKPKDQIEKHDQVFI